MLESFWGTLCPKKASYWIQKKVFAIMNMPPPKTPQGHSGFQWHGSILPMIHLGFCIHHGPNHQAIVENGGIWMDVGMQSNLGHHQNKVHGCPYCHCSMMGPRSSIYTLMPLTLQWGQCSPKILLTNATNPLHMPWVFSTVLRKITL